MGSGGLGFGGIGVHPQEIPLADDADEAIIPDPYFVMYPHLATLCGGRAVRCETYPDFRMTAERHGRSDFGELARRAVTGVLSAEIEVQGDLFATDHADLRLRLARLAQPPEFARMARRFFGEVTGRSLSSWLDRVLSTRIGPDARFQDVAERAAFGEALGQYCAESTRIIREFAAGWYGKTLWREGQIASEHASVFGHVAMKKIGEEMRRKRDG